jgi:acyl carrier protein
MTQGETRLEKPVPTVATIEAWLIAHVAEMSQMDPSKIDAKARFDRLGLDSIGGVSLMVDLEEWLGYEVDATLVYDYPTIASTAQVLADQARTRTIDRG